MSLLLFIRLFHKVDVNFGSSSLAHVYEVSVGFLSFRNASSPETPGNCDEHRHKKVLEIQVPLVTRSYSDTERDSKSSVSEKEIAAACRDQKWSAPTRRTVLPLAESRVSRLRLTRRRSRTDLESQSARLPGPCQ